MRKITALILTIIMLCGVTGSLAEEGQISPLYATVGEALEHCDEERVIAGGVVGEYFAVVTREDGKYYRSVALYDEKLKELEDAAGSLDFEAEDFFEKLEEATKAEQEYRKTLPIAYSEEFTAQPLSDGEMESRIGKTLAQLAEEGFETMSDGTEPGEGDETAIVYSLRYGVYDYNCVVDADVDRYTAAQENGTEGELTVKSMTLAGITAWGFDKRFHTDGTVDEEEDPFAEFSEIMTEVGTFMEKAQAGEAVDTEGFCEELKAKYPDYADMIEMYVSLYQLYGADGLAAMMTPGE